MQKILIVDDEPALRHTLGAILKRAGYAPVLAGSGQEGMQKLREEDFSLLFLDIKLPDGLGVDLLPEIHRIDADLPVIVLTAHATLEAAMQAVRGGARDFLLKPIDPAAILERVSQILEETKQPQRQRQILSQVQGLLAELGSPPASGTPSAVVSSQRERYARAVSSSRPRQARFVTTVTLWPQRARSHARSASKCVTDVISGKKYAVTNVTFIARSPWRPCRPRARPPRARPCAACAART